VRQCAAVCGSVRQCATVCGSAAVCGSAGGSVRKSGKVCGSANGSVWQCEWLCVAVRQWVAARAAVCCSALDTVCLFVFDIITSGLC
jgi:hypothetical protein